MTHQIIPATAEAMQEIESWLDEEEAVYQATGHTVRGFRCNWDTVKRTWRDYDEPVDILMVDQQPIGFLAGTDILEIKPDRRRMGYGRVLAQFMINRARLSGELKLEIGIYPLSALPFWESMGFTLVPRRGHPSGGMFAFLELTSSN